MPDPPSIRRAAPPDLDGLVELERTCFQPHRRASARSLARSISSPHQSVWLIDDGPEADAPAAFIVLWHRPRTFRVYDVATHPARRGEGLAGALLGHAEGLAEKAGADRVSLEAEPAGPGLVAWYEKRGYRVVQELPGYYGPGHDAVRMTKRLRA